MSESVEKRIKEIASVPLVLLEAGAGPSAGSSIPENAEKVRQEIEAGAVFITIDRQKKNLEHIQHGAVSHMGLKEFAISDFLNNSVDRMYICNVFGENNSGLSTEGDARLVLGALRRKLSPTGTIIIVENYTPFVSEFLHNIQFQDFGYEVTRSASLEEYKTLMGELGLAETKDAKSWAHILTGTFERPWEPFVLLLKNKAS